MELDLFPNKIAALGISDWNPVEGFRSSALELGPCGAVVVGLNGAGKTRFVSQIGEAIDLIYENPLSDHWYQIIAPDDDIQPWNVINEWKGGEDHQFHEDPKSTYLEIRDFILQARINPDDAVGWSMSSRARALISDWKSWTESESHVIATIALSSGPTGKIGTSSQLKERPETVYLIAASREIWKVGRLGISRLSDLQNTRARVWFNTNPQETPVFLELSSAVEGSSAFQFSLADDGAIIPPEHHQLDNPDLQEISDEPAILLPKRGNPGVFESSTRKLPMLGYCKEDVVLNEGKEYKSIFDGLRTLQRPTFRPGFAKSYVVQYRDFVDRYGNHVRWSDLDEEEEAIRHAEGPLEILSISDIPRVYRWDSEVLDYGRAVVGVANQVLRLLLQDPPILDLVDTFGELSWKSNGRDLSTLSAAQSRWSRFSIWLSEHFLNRLLPLVQDKRIRAWVTEGVAPVEVGVSSGLPGTLLVIDEPEVGIHRGAETHLVKGLLRLCHLCGVKPIIATHSPVFVRELLATNANVFHVHKTLDDLSMVSSFSAREVEILGEAAGIEGSDLLQLVRAFLLVEGEHDAQVLRAIVGQELDRLGIRVVPFRGARGVSQVVDSRLLWDFTDAKIFVLLDSIKAAPTRAIWQEIRSRSQVEDANLTDTLHELLDKSDLGGSLEIKALKELLSAALKMPGVNRLEILGLQERDIIDYFDPESLIDWSSNIELSHQIGDHSWKTLTKAWRRSTSGLDFKSWITFSFPGTSFEAERLASIAGKWDHIPADFVKILDDCQQYLYPNSLSS